MALQREKINKRMAGEVWWGGRTVPEFLIYHFEEVSQSLCQVR